MIKQTSDYIGYLNDSINTTKGCIDLNNPNSKIMEYCHLLTFLNKELEKVRLHQEYLNDFKHQLFRQMMKLSKNIQKLRFYYIH